MARAAALVGMLAALLAAQTRGERGAVIMDVTPRNMGMMGGGLVTIKGSGFERDGEEGATVVYLGNVRCRAIEYYSSDTQIVCVTDDYPIETNLPITGTRRDIDMRYEMREREREI